MKKLLLSVAFLSFMATNAQITIFEDSFEDYTDFAIENVGNWTLLDVDQNTTYGFQGVTFPNTQVAKSFQVFNATATTPALDPSAAADWTARTGAKHMVCFAAAPNPTPVALNNDWMISPEIQLGSAGNQVSFWAKACDFTYGLERFRVGISTTDTAPASFTIISPAPYITTTDDGVWVEYTYNLDAYQGQQVYIGIHCVSNDQFGFAVDDFKVTATTLSTETFFANNFSLYPNPASDVLNINSKSNTAISQITITDMNGRIVKEVKNMSVTNTIVNVADLTSGLYIINVTSNEGSGAVKFAKN